MENKASIVFLTDFDLQKPSGAGWNRVQNYTMALEKKGVPTIILSSRYDYSKGVVKEVKGLRSINLSNIKIEYKSSFEDFHFKRYRQFLRQVIRLNRDLDCRYFLYNSRLNSALLTLIKLKIGEKRIAVIEKNELQLAIASNSGVANSSFTKAAIATLLKSIRVLASIVTDSLAFFYSGIVVISTRFEKLYSLWNNDLLRIPILVNGSLCEEGVDSDLESKSCFKIGYFGFISEKKDGVISLIQSVKAINKNSQLRLELHLYGGFASYRAKYFQSLIDGEQVYFHGSIPASEVKPELQKFDLLALVRPQNLQTQYGFSTKLGEYLMSGVPVLASNVSDNAKYLKDGEEAFILNLGKEVDQKALEAKIRQIIEIPGDQRRQVGLQGREKAQKEFDYRNHAQALTDFIFSL